MNDFSDLEGELKQLRPRAVSAELEARIESALAQQATSTATAGLLPQRATFRLNWFALTGGLAAACVVVLAIISIDRPRPIRPTTAAASRTASPTAIAAAQVKGGFVPDGLTRVVYHRRDEGLIYPRTADTPVRRVRSQTRETLQWREPGTGASLRVSYPTEEVELIPVSGQ